MKKRKPAVYCFVPGCWGKPVTDNHYGAGRCPEHRYTSQDGVQGAGKLPLANPTAQDR